MGGENISKKCCLISTMIKLKIIKNFKFKFYFPPNPLNLRDSHFLINPFNRLIANTVKVLNQKDQIIYPIDSSFRFMKLLLIN